MVQLFRKLPTIYPHYDNIVPTIQVKTLGVRRAITRPRGSTVRKLDSLYSTSYVAGHSKACST